MIADPATCGAGEQTGHGSQVLGIGAGDVLGRETAGRIGFAPRPGSSRRRTGGIGAATTFPGRPDAAGPICCHAETKPR